MNQPIRSDYVIRAKSRIPLFYTDLTQNFHMHPFNVESCDKYFVLHWSGAFLAERMLARKSTTLLKDGYTFFIQLIDGVKLEDLISAPRVALSFRKEKNRSIGYVIPRIVIKSDGPLDMLR